ncbi:Nucleolar protein 14 [Holothuria leucospilota]|uniref:Nucleolar protein 14 n=1 Tax=Holothuria leucospilota TaxID=206669 RepID=A0A9Q0YN38_HOLLE|nr:Nucleolar protein 14 [Holothuria leucospilota]
MPKSNRNRKQFSQKKAKVRSNREVRSNPFEIRINRQKHPILGRKRKHEKGNPGVARSKAIEKRKNTLLKEYQQRHKSNKFIDKRISEHDPTMSVEDKMLERFAFEKQKVHEKSSIYNLADEEEELTHYGQSLADIEKFEDGVSDVEDDDKATDALKPVEDNIGGFLLKKKTSEDESEEKPRSREDVMLDIIANSKKEKYERQKEKEGALEKTDELDKDFHNVMHLLAKMKSKKDSEPKQKADDYDITVRELMFEAKAMPTDRLKTPEEQAKEEKARLEKLEADRKRRMLGISEDDEKQKARKHRGADDLNDCYELEPDRRALLSYKDGKPLNPLFLQGAEDTKEKEETPAKGEDDEEMEGEGDGEEEDGGEEEAGEEDDSDMEEEDEDENASEDIEDLESEDGSEGEGEEEMEMKKKMEELKEKKRKKKEMMKKAKEELPFTFQVPATYTELTDLLYHHPPAKQVTILERMRSCNHPSLAEGNKAKLESLLSLLVQYFCGLTDEEPLNMELIHGITKHIYELSKTSHIPTGTCFRDVLLEKYQAFKDTCQRRSQGIYPPVSVLLYFKLISLVFPTSDFKHCVVTPALLFMGEILSQCHVRSLLDVTKGLFICNLFLQYVHLSKRIVPEVINFLHGMLFLSKQKKVAGKLDQVFPPFKPVGKHINYLVLSEDRSESTSCPAMKIKDLFNFSHNSSHLDNDDFRIWATNLSLSLLREFLNMYKDQDSSFELFDPVRQALTEDWINVGQYPASTKELHQNLLSDLDALKGKTKRALERTRRRPVCLKMFEPKFEENYDPTRKDKNTGDKEKDNIRKLVHKHRQEMKGAARELRKDTQFLARQKLKEQIERDNERKEKVKRLYGMLANQEGDFKAMQRKAKKVKF